MSEKRDEETSVAALAARIAALPPSCGRSRLVAVDGYAGAGKTTFAAQLAATLESDAAQLAATLESDATQLAVPVVHTDDLACHEDFFGWDTRLLTAVVEPLCRGVEGGYPRYDWVTGRFGERVGVAPAPVVLIEGVGAGRSSVRPFLALTIWLDVPREVAAARGRRRDGAALERFWARWLIAQDRFFTVEHPWRDAVRVPLR